LDLQEFTAWSHPVEVLRARGQPVRKLRAHPYSRWRGSRRRTPCVTSRGSRSAIWHAPGRHNKGRSRLALGCPGGRLRLSTGGQLPYNIRTPSGRRRSACHGPNRRRGQRSLAATAAPLSHLLPSRSRAMTMMTRRRHAGVERRYCQTLAFLFASYSWGWPWFLRLHKQTRTCYYFFPVISVPQIAFHIGFHSVSGPDASLEDIYRS
jgi:hypothetical protein